jgi:hypothetical protein
LELDSGGEVKFAEGVTIKIRLKQMSILTPSAYFTFISMISLKALEPGAIDAVKFAEGVKTKSLSYP